jgi:hypothetical protein
MSRHVLMSYEDRDGDSITILWDPVDDSGEDVRIVVHSSTSLAGIAVRAPLGALRGALAEAPA